LSAGEKLTRPPKGAWLKSRDQFRNFGTPYNFPTVKDGKFVFGAHIKYNMY